MNALNLNTREIEYILIKKEIEFYKNKENNPSIYPQFSINEHINYLKHLAIQNCSYSIKKK